MAQSFLDTLFMPSKREQRRREAEDLRRREVEALEKIAAALGDKEVKDDGHGTA